MNNPIVPLIPVNDYRGKTAVSLRDLHAFLEVKKDFTSWAKQMFEYGFTENEDYVEILLPQIGEQVHGGHNKRNWAISLDMAKELSMIQRTDKGKQARQYFIEVEKQARNIPAIPQSYAEALRAHANEVEAHEQSKAMIAVLEPKAASWDSIVGSKGSWSFNDAAKVLCESGQIATGEKRLVRQLVDWGYLYRDHKGRPHAFQRFIDMNIFETKARTYEDHETGERKASSAPQVRITGKGLDRIRQQFLNEKKAA